MCGISVVPGDYERLKRYNLAELHQPTSKAEAARADAATAECSEAANDDKANNTTNDDKDDNDNKNDKVDQETRRPCTPPANEPTPPVASPAGN